jgi:hypothetical protein
MRKSPGAPKPVANATTFSFHPFKPNAKYISFVLQVPLVQAYSAAHSKNL